MKRKLLLFCVICIQLLSAALGPRPVVAQGGAMIPAQVQTLARPGETIVAMRPVNVEGQQLSTYYFTTGADEDTLGKIFYNPAAGAWQRAGIQGIVVMDGTAAVTGEVLLRQAFFTSLAGYMAEQLPKLPTAITADPSLVEQLHRLTDDPIFQVAFIEQQAKSLFKSNEDMDVLALKGMLVAKTPDAIKIKTFTEDVKGELGTLNSVEDAIDATILTAKYSNDRQVRQLAAEVRKLFTGWKRVSSDQFDVIGVKVEAFNVFDLISLGVQLTYIDQLSLERADMLERLAYRAAQNAPPLTPSLQRAIATAVAETRSASRQREDILLRFVKEKAGVLAVKLGTDALLKLWVQTTWDTFGKRTVGHLVAGAGSAVLLGFTAGNLLYGMDDIFENTVIAQRAASMEDVFMNGALWAKVKKTAQGSPYDDKIADTYRTCVLFKNLAAAQVYRSYADSIAASRLVKVLADLVTGQQWTIAEQSFRKWADDSELTTENLLVHPPIIEEAVALTLQTLQRKQPTPASPVPGTSTGGQTATALVIDVSGSMGANWQGGVKIESAKQAAADVVTMIEQESQSGQGAHQIALVSFTTDASLESPLSADHAGMRDAIDRLSPSEDTNLGAGVEVANQTLSAAPAEAQKIVILLSDGLSNEGLSNAEILSGPVQAAADAGICIYTIGFGDSGDIDEDLLREIAARSRCGTYTYASAPADLARIYIRLRHQSTSDILDEFQGWIAQGETVQIGQVTVPANQGQLNVTLQWPGSRLELIAKDPSGKAVADGQPGVSIAQTARMVNLLVQNPPAGIWQFAAVGAEVPEQQLTYNLIASVRTGGTKRTEGGSAGLLIAFVAAVLIGVPVVVVGAKRRRQRLGAVPAGAATRLIGPAGELLPVADGAVLGRDPGCAIRLLDDAVSKQHARFRYARGAWYIQDLDSSNGTFVNGARVTATALQDGDRITIGPYELKLRIGL